MLNESVQVNVAKNNMSSSGEDSNIANLKILITDDIEPTRMLLGILIEKLAKEIIYTQNGVEAVVACQDNLLSSINLFGSTLQKGHSDIG